MILLRTLGSRSRGWSESLSYSSMAVPQPDGLPEAVPAAEVVVLVDWAAARLATPRMMAAEKRMFAGDLA